MCSKEACFQAFDVFEKASILFIHNELTIDKVLAKILTQVQMKLHQTKNILFFIKNIFPLNQLTSQKMIQITLPTTTRITTDPYTKEYMKRRNFPYLKEMIKPRVFGE